MAKALADEQVSRLCEAFRVDLISARHRAEVCQQLFARTGHLHGLTKTARPLLELAALLHGAAGAADPSSSSAPRLGAALKHAASDLTLEQRRIVLDAVRQAPTSPDGSALSGEGDGTAHQLALRIDAIVELADALDHSRTHDTQLAAVLDDGETIDLLVSGGERVRENAAEAARRTARWNAHMLRPIRSVVVCEGTTPPTALVLPHHTMAEAARRIFRTQWEQFAARTYGLHYGQDIEFVHELRVALRRLRAALRVFRKAVDGAVPALRRELNQLAKALGAVRDADVFLDFLRRYEGQAPPDHVPHVQRLVRAEQRKRRQHCRTLFQAFASERYAEFQRSYVPMIVGRDGASDGLQSLGGPADHPVSRHAPRMVRKCLKKVTKYDRRLERLAPEEQHALRIECKRLRYTAEFLADLYPGGLSEIIKPATSMQDTLGDVHDADVYKGRILGYHERRRKGRDDPAADEAIHALVGYIELWRVKSLRKAVETWSAFMRKKNLRRVDKLIHSPSAAV